MPHPIDYQGGQDEDLTRSIDVVHIGPSIREGTVLVSSIYGKGASAPIRRFPPVNTVAPYISGSGTIPSTLTCNVGQWSSSPSSEFFFQWMVDGVDIPNANNQTLDTIPDWDDMIVTCEVRGENGIGEGYATTPVGILLDILEPLEINDADFSVVSGLGIESKLVMHTERNSIITGISATGRSDVVRNVVYIVSGKAGENKNDVNSMNVNVITGLGKENTLQVQEDSGCMVISIQDGEVLEDGLVQLMPIKNPEAELGEAGWEIFGEAETIQAVFPPDDGRLKDRVWWGGEDVDSEGSNTPYSFAYQDVEVYPIWQSDVDAGSCFVDVSWYQSSASRVDEGNVRLEFLSENKIVIGNDSGAGLSASKEDVWLLRNFSAAVPVDTRYVRVYMEFNLVFGSNNNAMIDQLTMNIHKGVKQVSRDLGPSFEMWRLFFTRSNTYSGVALSEIEFRNGIGGSDLAIGGSELSGSVGNGGTASAAFDDFRNGDYWAGEEDAVVSGTSWIGYDMGTSVFPSEIDITARTGSDSLQVGRDFTLQGSDDGVNWTSVQRYTEIGIFTSGQQRQFVVDSGAFDWWAETSLGESADKTISLTDSPVKGMIFQAKARLTIDELKAYVPSGTTNILSIFKVNFEKSNGLVEEQIVSVTAPVTTEEGWVEVSLPEDFILEVGDYFGVTVSVSTGSNVDVFSFTDQTEDQNDGSYNLFDGHLVTKHSIWRSDEQISLSAENSNSVGSGYFCVDFKGSIF